MTMTIMTTMTMMTMTTMMTMPMMMITMMLVMAGKGGGFKWRCGLGGARGAGPLQSE
jgi:hypothetical protein